MASGDLTCNTPRERDTEALIKGHIDGLNLTAVTDELFVIPTHDNYSTMIFKVEREA